MRDCEGDDELEGDGIGGGMLWEGELDDDDELEDGVIVNPPPLLGRGGGAD